MINMKYGLNMLTLLSSWLVQAGINLIQIEVVALEEVSFLLLKKPRCLHVNLVGDDNFAPVNQPSACALWNLFGMVLLPMSISHWIQMFGPKQGMGRRFNVSPCLNYPFYKKTSGRWDELLKTHY
jgi:hypothetical protein